MKRAIWISILLLPVVSGSMVRAAPSITGVSGTLSGDANDASANLITITGSNFGAVGGPPMVWAPMNSDINPSILGRWQTWNAGQSDRNVSTGTLCRSGAGCLTGNATWYVDPGASIDVGISVKVGYGKHLFTHHGRKVTYSSNTPTTNTKYDRLWDNFLGANSHTLVLNNNAGLDKIYEHTSESHNQNKFMTKVFVPGRDTAWHTIEYKRIINSAEGLSDGSLEVRSDTWTETNTSVQTDSGGNPADFDPADYFLEDDPANTPARNDGEYTYMDDIYISTTFARIYLANNSTLADATTTEMLIPKTWSDTSITAYFHQGIFASGASAWIFVCDDTALISCSAAQAITIGAGTTNLHPALGSITQTSMQASWDNVSPNQLAVISANSDFSSPISSGNATTPQTYNSLTCNTQYYFEVKVTTEPDSGYTSTNATTSACSAAAGPGSWKANGLKFNAVKF